MPCDSWPFPELFAPSLSFVHRDAALMGRTAAELLLDRIQHGITREVIAADGVHRQRAVTPTAAVLFPALRSLTVGGARL